MSTAQPRPIEAVGESFGLLRIESALLALPVSAIREVVRGQTTYAPLPIKADGVIGAIDVRGTIISVLDLRLILGLPLREEADHVVVIVRCEGKLIGLRACEVCDLARPPMEDLCLFSIEDRTGFCLLASYAFKCGDTIAAVLDPMAIARLPNVPLVAEKTAGHAMQDTSATKSIVIFRYGRSLFGIDADCVDATVPATRIIKHAVGTDVCLGVIDHHGFYVPVVDTSAAFGLGRGTPASETPVIVLRFAGDAMLGLAIDEVHDFARISEADILAMPELGIEGAPLFRGLISREAGRQVLLLETTNVLKDPDLLALARLRRPRLVMQGGDKGAKTGSDRIDRGTSVTRTANAFLVYVAAGPRATALHNITEILTYPTEIIPFDVAGRGVRGLFSHRGRTTPLVCLSTLLGAPRDVDTNSVRILFVQDGNRAAGFIVEALTSIENQSGPGTVSEQQALLKSPAIMGQAMVTLGEDRRIVAHIDLIAELDKVVSKPIAPLLAEAG